MMIEEGKKAESIWWESDRDAIKATPDSELIYHEEYLGDHSEQHILQMENGVEVARQNMRHISTIKWVV